MTRNLIHLIGSCGLLLLNSGPATAQIPTPTQPPGFTLVDLDLGETQSVTLADGTSVRLKLLHLDEQRDAVRQAIRQATATVLINDQEAQLSCSHYHLPKTIGPVRIDCPITKGHYQGVAGDPWGLDKQVRLRLWPAAAPLTEPGSFSYPLKQRWFASATSMANEPIDAGVTSGYVYHYDLDFGGAEALTEVVSATDALVVSCADDTLPGYEDSPVRARYDVIYLLDDRGFFYRYSHFHRIDPNVKTGQRVRLGQPLGLLGKQGSSGGWSHLHFGLWTKMPSGKWGSLDVYPLVWEAYLRDQQPSLIAVAQPGHLIFAGDSVQLDGSKSWSATGPIASFQWTLSDGTQATTARLNRRYPKPGRYCEALKIQDSQGNTAYDFVRVLVVDPTPTERFPPNVHAAFWPTQGLRAGEPVTLKVRSFRTTEGREKINFGDGSPTVHVQSKSDAGNLDPNGYATIIHRYQEPGDYLVRIDRENESGWPAFTYLHIAVLPK